MKTKIMSLFAAGIVAASIVSGCGGGGTPGVDSAAAFSNANLALKNGDIATAQAEFDAALKADGDNHEAAFGAGLMRLLRLAESEPTAAILSLLGQKGMKLSALFGPEGYLKAMDDINHVDISLAGLEGSFSGQARLHGQNFFADDSEECHVKTLSLDIIDTERKTVLGGFVVLSVTAPDGTLLYHLENGAELEVGQKLLDDRCFGEMALMSLNVYADKTNYGSYYPGASGKLVVQTVSEEEGGEFQLYLQDVVLNSSDGSKQKAISGDLFDHILAGLPEASIYFPFAASPGERLNIGRQAWILRSAKDGLMLSELQDQTLGYIPLIQEIAELFQRADADDDFQFVVPKELYFGGEDISLNRADLKAIRAAMEFKLAGFFFANSWDCPINLGDYYDSEGKKLYTDEQLLGQLNECLTLREDHHIDEAKEHIVRAFELALENDDLRQSVAVDGLFDNDGKGKGGYVELRDVVEILKNSLKDDQVFLYVDPALTINLGHLFSNPPDASQVDVDPFVLENGKIKPVEAFFKSYLEGVVDFDTTANYKSAFVSLTKDFWHLLFDEFNVFTVGGKDIGFGDFYE